MTKKILIIVLTKLMIVISFLFLFAGIEAQAQYLSLNPGSVGSNQSICYNTSPATFTQTATPTGGTGSYTYCWQEQQECTGSWSDIAGAVSSTYQPNEAVQTICYRRKVISGYDSAYSNTIAQGLKARYPFDSDFFDRSGNNYHSINYGALWTTDKDNTTNSAINFTGSQYVDLNYGSGLNPATTPHTFTLWTKPSRTDINRMVMSAGQTGGTNNRFFIGIYGGNWDMGIRTTSWGSGTINATTDWTHLALVMDGTTAKLYVNGNVTRTISYTSYNFNRNIFLANHDNNYYYQGKIDEVQIFDRALSLSEVNALSQSPFLKVSILPVLVPGSIGNNQTVCYNASPDAFTATAAAGGTGSYTYCWQEQEECTGSWTDIAGAVSSTYQPNESVQTICYRRKVISGCDSAYSNTIAQGLKARYPFNSDFFDRSGNNYHSINYGALWTTDKDNTTNSAINFTGSQYVDLNYGSGLNPATTPHTFSFWTKPSATGTNIMVMSAGQTGGTNNRFYIGINGGKWDMGIQTAYWGSGTINATTDWTHLVLVMDGTNAKLYVNGNVSRTISYTSYNFNRNIWLANHDNNYYYQGKIDEVQIFDRALTDNEIYSMYHDAIKVTVNPLPTANAGPDTLIFAGDSVQIGSSPVGGNTYLWSPSAGLSNSNIANPWAKPLLNTTFYLTVTNSYGCMSNDSIKISILGSSCDISLSITADTVFNPDTLAFADTVIWLSFIADTTYIQFLISKTSSYQTSSLSLFTGNCNSLLLIKEYSDTLDFYSNSLSVGNQYFIKFSKPNFDTVSFGLSVMKSKISLPYPVFTCTPSTCPNLVLNSEFDSTWIQSLIIPPDCPYFETDYEFYYLPTQSSIHKSIGITAHGNDLNSTWLSGGGYFGGNFLAFDMFPADSTSPMDKAIWRQVIQNITPYKTYYYSFYAKNLNFGDFNPCLLGVRINDTTQVLDYVQNQPCTTDVVPIPSSGEGYNEWVHVCGTWTNTTLNSVIFEIFGRETSSTGANEDGGIDHIEFRQLEPNISISASCTLICDTDTIITLNASGGLTYQWSSTPSGFTSSLQNPTATPLVTTTYTVTITRDCNTETASVVVYVSNAPTVDAGTDTSICLGQSYQIGGSPTASGGTSPYHYYWNVNPSGTGNLSNFLVPNPIATPTVSTTYTLTVTDMDGGGCSASDAVVITVNPLPNASAGVNQDICIGQSTDITASGGISYLWSNGSSTATINVSPSVTTTYTVTVTDANGCSATSSMVLSVYSELESGAIADNQTICYNTTPASFTQTTAPTGGTGSYTYQWQSTTVSGCGSGWSYISGATASTYQPGNLTQNTCYRREVTSSPCGTGYSNTITVTVYPSLTAGSVGSNQSICYNTSPAAFTQTGAPTGGTGSYTYQWQSTTVSGCGSGWSNVAGATASTYQAGNLTQTTCYMRIVTSGACGSANSNAITVTVYGNLTAGSVGSNQSICYNTSPAAFTQVSSPTGGTGSYTYQWQQQPGCSGGWSDISGATASTYDVPGNITQTTCYIRVVTSVACGSANSNAITVTVYDNLTAGSVGSNQSICYNTNPAAFTQVSAPSGGTGSYTYQWQYTTVSGCGSGWGNIAGATASTYQAGNLTQTTCYMSIVTSGACGSANTNVITVTVYGNLTAGSVSSNQSICYNTSPAAFTQTAAPTGGTGTYTYQWQEQPGCTGVWTNISGATATTYDVPGNITQTTCYRRNVTSSSCGTVSSSVITVTVNALPNANAGADDDICIGSNTTLNASGGTTYAWSPTGSLSNPNIYNPVASPTITTTYIVTVTDANGCSATDDVVVSLITDLCLCDATPMLTTWDYNYGISLNSSTLYELSQDATISGNVVLTGISIRIEDYIQSSSPIRITITAGNSLTLDNCHLFACEEMWEGIVVTGSGTLEIINGSLIEDARNAVNMHTLTSPTLTVDGSVFNKNFIGILINGNGFQPTTSPYPFDITNTIFTSRVLTPVSLATWPTPAVLGVLEQSGYIDEHYSIGNTTYLPSLLLSGAAANTGISLNDVGYLNLGIYFEIEINGDDPNTGTTVNIFDNLYFGINATNSNLTCSNNAFQYITGTGTWIDGMAIKAHNSNTPFTSENRIKVVGSGTGTKNNYFYDCKIGIDVYNYDVIEISDVNMRSDHGTIEGLIGIQIETVQSSDLEIGNNTLTNILYGILFTGLNATYIGTLQSQNIHGPFNIHNNVIQANLPGSTFSTENVTLGILIRNLLWVANPVTQNDCNSLNITENMLYNVRNGIKAEKWLYYYYEITEEDYMCMGNRPVIESNYITLVDPNAATQFGINSILNWNGIIENNNIQGFSNADVGYYGIRCENNLSVPFGNPDNGQIVQCNEVNNVGKGIEFVDDQIDTKFFNNTMEACFWGFVLNNNAVIGQQGDENSDLGSNNSWPVSSYDNNNLPGQCKTYVIGSIAQTSRFVVDQTNNNQNPESQGIAYNSGNPFSANDVYRIASGNLIPISNNTNSIVCNTASNSLKSNSQSGNLASNTSNFINWLEKLVQDSVENKVYPAEQYINNKFRVYRMLEVQPLLMGNSTILKNFYITAKNGHIGNITNIENALALGQNVLAQSQLNNISANNDIEANYLDFYSLYKKYADSTFSASDSILLKTIAEGCPARDGIAVYYARTLYSYLYKDFLLFTDNCLATNALKLSIDNNNSFSENSFRIEVYPNPNEGSFSIKLDEGSEIQYLELSIYNTIGMKIFRNFIELQNNVASFKSNLPNGIYLLQFSDVEKNTHYSTKIIIIK